MGRAMAEGSDMHMKAHEQTYGAFLVLLKWGTIVAFIVAAIVIAIIAS